MLKKAVLAVERIARALFPATYVTPAVVAGWMVEPAVGMVVLAFGMWIIEGKIERKGAS